MVRGEAACEGASASCGPGTEAPRMSGDTALPLPPQTFPVPSVQLATGCESARKWQGARSQGTGQKRGKIPTLHPIGTSHASSQQYPDLDRNLARGRGGGMASFSPMLTSPPNHPAAPRPSISALFRLSPDPKPALPHHVNPIPNLILTPAPALSHHSSNYKPHTHLYFTSSLGLQGLE